MEDVFDEYGEKKMLARFREIVESGGGGRGPAVGQLPRGALDVHLPERGLNPSFKDLNFERFIDPRTLSLNVGSMVDTVIFNSNSYHMGRKAILSRLDKEAHALEDQ